MFALLVLLALLSTSSSEILSGSKSKDYSHLLTKFGDVNSHPLIHGTDDLEFERLKERVRIVHEMLRAECPSSQKAMVGRRSVFDVSKSEQQVETIMYGRMIRMLIECRQRNAAIATPSPTTTPATTPPPTTTPATTTLPTTTTLPSECRSAINLTESWRQDHNGSGIKPTNSDYQCDTREMTSSDRPWFRFSGAAGNMMLNKCPPQYSCGTHAGVWTDAVMPSDVGAVATIQAQGATKSCYLKRFILSVMKCSYNVPNDFVYRMTAGYSGCNYGFCGMSKLD